MSAIEIDQLVVDLARTFHDAVEEGAWQLLDRDARERYERLGLIAIEFFRHEIGQAYDLGFDEGVGFAGEETPAA